MKQSQTGERVLISFDYALKRLLRNKVNYEVVEGFLSELLMTDISVKNITESESNKEHATDKSNRVDILVEDKTGEIMLIELQFTLEIDYLHRMLYGTSKAITERMHQGAKYMEVRKVYSINIVYFDLGQGNDYIYHGKTHFTGLHKNDPLRLSQTQRDAFGKENAGDIYPEYYILKINSFDDTTKDQLDEWVYFFKHNIIKDEFKAKGLDKAREVLDRDKLSPEERNAYDSIQWHHSKDLSDYYSAVDEGMTKGKIEREKLAKELKKRDKELEKEREEREKEREQLLAEIARLKQNKQK
jgi:predicted transposase/invertase (TIGR01784 family)